MSEESAAKGATPWHVPAIDGSDGKGYMTAGRLQALQKDAYDEAYAKGHAEGLVAGEKEIAARAARYDELLRALSLPFDQLDDTVEAQLIELSVVIVKQLFRREIKIDPGHLVGVVRDAIKALPVASRNVQLHLHPEDAELIRMTLSGADNEPAWGVVEDPLITRGGCNVTTDNARIDATAESRLHAVISQVFDEERSE